MKPSRPSVSFWKVFGDGFDVSGGVAWSVLESSVRSSWLMGFEASVSSGAPSSLSCASLAGSVDVSNEDCGLVSSEALLEEVNGPCTVRLVPASQQPHDCVLCRSCYKDSTSVLMTAAVSVTSLPVCFSGTCSESVSRFLV